VLITWERKSLRTIHWPTYENDYWRNKMNLEIYNVFKSPDIVTLIKAKLRRLERLNVARMDGERTVKKLLEANRWGGGGGKKT
jgi:hypothetical protein